LPPPRPRWSWRSWPKTTATDTLFSSGSGSSPEGTWSGQTECSTPVLHRLERLGLVEARWEVAESGRRRKYYRITSQGRNQLTEERRQWQAVDAALRDIWKVLSLFISASHPALPALPSYGA
jgi:hypothetical protein